MDHPLHARHPNTSCCATCVSPEIKLWKRLHHAALGKGKKSSFRIFMFHWRGDVYMFKTIVLGHLVYFEAVYKVVKIIIWLVVSTHLKNMLVRMGSSSPRTGVKRNNL